ncbi:Crp/Fnr family transcriptional regulator [Sphingomonas sp. CFBP 13603]|uniref:Crp/Fnr family transcriptional regulator n=1 Tax=Sphingomonas sp. CFBP 13603 TaxID=2774040 RepID=UPI0018678298|nr:Crp/Fnr family transcriptional regulator [Sphingomonas sp. CFBP 13603]MBE2994188.1 Crp/Fnr family transcriptional regulator [Sphingomonas sp. CFBP 13603]
MLMSDAWLADARSKLKSLFDVFDLHGKTLVSAQLTKVLELLDTKPDEKLGHVDTDEDRRSLAPAMKPASFKATNPLITKLSRVMTLSQEDCAALQAMWQDVRQTGARRDIIRDGDRPERVHLILNGWACRYKILKNGKRQITALLLPGDFCDLHVGVLDQMDHAIGAITSTTFAYVDRLQFEELTSSRPAIMRALWWATLVDEGVLRSWLVSLGVRTARERVAHLICELRERMRNIDREDGGQFAMPLTQPDLAEALGLTAVHINRVVRQLMKEGVLEIRKGQVTVLDLPALTEIAEFDPSYLHAQSIDKH